jgi:hypothetical protein
MHELPGLHTEFGIAAREPPHTPAFAEAAGMKSSFDAAIIVGKAMALTGWDVLTNDVVMEGARRDFEAQKGL